MHYYAMKPDNRELALEGDPGDEHQDGQDLTVLRHLHGLYQGVPMPTGPATLESYQMLVEDHPRKFAPAQVGYDAKGGDKAEHCGNCFHFYIQPRSGQRVCEILRLPNRQDIADGGICKFWTENGDEHPRLSASESQKTDSRGNRQATAEPTA